MDARDFLIQGEGREEDKKEAWTFFQQAYEHQMKGELEEAVDLYKKSIASHPTAEAYTFLGWTYSFMGRLDEAIEECHHAIQVDPDFGNPYNDIGAYLLELGRWQEALPWFEKAMAAPRYEARIFPYVNKGRALEHLGRAWEALEAYRQAMAVNPEYLPARQAFRALLGKLN